MNRKKFRVMKHALRNVTKKYVTHLKEEIRDESRYLSALPSYNRRQENLLSFLEMYEETFRWALTFHKATPGQEFIQYQPTDLQEAVDLIQEIRWNKPEPSSKEEMAIILKGLKRACYGCSRIAVENYMYIHDAIEFVQRLDMYRECGGSLTYLPEKKLDTYRPHKGIALYDHTLDSI